MFRFDCRQAPNGYAVWDSTVAGWYSEWNLSEVEASRQATELDVSHGFYADRQPADVRPYRAGPFRCVTAGAARVTMV
jgi:hypothetical protein